MSRGRPIKNRIVLKYEPDVDIVGNVGAYNMHFTIRGRDNTGRFVELVMNVSVDAAACWMRMTRKQLRAVRDEMDRQVASAENAE